DSSGNATFSNLTSGTYSICEVLQNTWHNSDPGPDSNPCKSVVVTAGNQSTVALGNYQNATITVVKYRDDNANGSQDAGEPALNGWTFFRDDNANGSRDLGEEEQTAASGSATFSVTPGSAYRICEETQATWTNSDPGGTAPFCKRSEERRAGGAETPRFATDQNTETAEAETERTT